MLAGEEDIRLHAVVTLVLLSGPVQTRLGPLQTANLSTGSDVGGGGVAFHRPVFCAASRAR
jgi:hypothetical protein